uniref:Secreted protein n=1 Tax=Anguilla anguilla TaxID=7936 RepID=A0A0E9PID6_ANGAN
MGCKMDLGHSLFVVFTCFLMARCRTEIGKNITVVVMLPDNHLKYSFAFPRVFPAIRMAHDDIQKKGKLWRLYY